MAVSSVIFGPANCHSKVAFRCVDGAYGWVPQRIDGCSLLFPPALPMPPQGTDVLTTPPSPRPGSLNMLQEPTVQTEQSLQADVVPPVAPTSLLRQMATACRNNLRPEPQPLSTAISASREDVQIDVNSMATTNREDTGEAFSPAISPSNMDRQSAPAPPPSPVFGMEHEVEIDSHEPGETAEDTANKQRSPRMPLATSYAPTPSKVPFPNRLTQQGCGCSWPKNDNLSSSTGLGHCKQQFPQSVCRPRSHSPRERLAGYRQHVPMTQPVPPKGFEGALMCLQCSLPASSCQRRRQHLSSWQPLGKASWPPPEMLKPVLSTKTKATTSSSSRIHACSPVSSSCLSSSARANNSDNRLQSDRRVRSTEARAQDGLPRPLRKQSSAAVQSALRTSSSTHSLSASTRNLAGSTTSLTGSMKSFKCLTARGAGSGHVAGGLPRKDAGSMKSLKCLV